MMLLHIYEMQGEILRIVQVAHDYGLAMLLMHTIYQELRNVGIWNPTGNMYYREEIYIQLYLGACVFVNCLCGMICSHFTVI